MSSAVASPARLPNVILFGTGEYTTGYVAGAVSTSDKPMGVVALTFFDLRARGLVGPKITLCGRSGSRASGIQQHLRDTIHKSYSLDVSCDIFPSDPAVNDPNSYLHVLNNCGYTAGDLAVVTTPDDTHKDIALACLQRGIHVIIAKPVVQSLEEHWELVKAVESFNASQPASSRPLVLVGEFHKRFDPIYSDAVCKIQSGTTGPLSYVHAYMSQPKSQLKTFQSWLLGGSKEKDSSTQTRAAPSDISFYLNSHHIDIVHLATHSTSQPVWVQALSAKGYANSAFNTDGANKVDIEDTITVMVQYAHNTSNSASASAASTAASSTAATSVPSSSSSPFPSFGIGVFTSSWIAPRSDVHSQQRFHFLGTTGEVTVDQAHRGYTVACDDNTKGLQSANPLFMRYQPNSEGRFVGQQGYGYKSFEHFVELVKSAPSTALSPHCHLSSLPAFYTTAILQAARLSLNEGNRKVNIHYDEHRRPTRLE